MSVFHDLHGQDEWRRRYDTLMHDAVDGMIVIDERGTVVEFNPAAERLFGYSADHAVGRNVSILMPSGDAAAHDRYVRGRTDAGPHGIGAGRRVAGRHRDGTLVPLHVSVSPLDLTGGRHYLGVLRDLSREVALQDALERQATHDHLTDLPNRALLLRRLDEELAHAEPGVLFLDLDGFKELNDSRGHVAGDLLLQQVASRLRHAVAEGDVLARLGGDEFIVLRPGRPQRTELERLAVHLIRAVERPFDVDGGLVHLSVSVGIARGTRQEDGAPVTAVSLLGDADTAMYVAKADGRGRWCHVTDEHRRASLARNETVERLRHALDEHELELHYQAQLHLGSWTVTSVEALLRWNHPDRGLLLPGTFLPIAERAGLMPRIDAYVVDAAARQAAAWDASGTPVRVWVNSAACHFDPACVDRLTEVLERHGCHPSLLGLEIGETQLMAEGRAKHVLSLLRDMGVRLAVDDFGTGYSNFARMRQLPIDTLKLDRSLVATITEDDTTHRVVAAVTDLGRSLGMQTVVEGVETTGQLDRVRDIGADYVQGFLLHRPAPALETVQLLTGAVEIGVGQPGASGRATSRTAALSGNPSR